MVIELHDDLTRKQRYVNLYHPIQTRHFGGNLTPSTTISILPCHNGREDILSLISIKGGESKMPQLATAAPSGAHFSYEEVKTNKGTESLGDVPLLVWDDLDACVAFYGEDGIKQILDGTSLRVSFQGMGRRMRAAGKSDDEIAQAQVGFRPGKRQAGASTPASRAGRAAKSAADALGDKADVLTALMKKIAAGELSSDEIEALMA